MRERGPGAGAARCAQLQWAPTGSAACRGSNVLGVPAACRPDALATKGGLSGKAGLELEAAEAGGPLPEPWRVRVSRPREAEAAVRQSRGPVTVETRWAPTVATGV